MPRSFGVRLVGLLMVIAAAACGGAEGSQSPSTATPAVSSMPTAGATASSIAGPASPSAAVGPVHGRFTATGSLSVARGGQVAVLLKDGRVLVLGGSDDASAELYEPEQGKFSLTGSIGTIGLTGETGNLLPDGRVLICGGHANSPDQEPLASAELYDPVTGSFAATGSMTHARSGHTATSLSDGRVLIVGGVDNSGATTASAEIYDPGTGKFSATGSLGMPRADHTATILPDGRVLIVGGVSTGAYDDPAPISAELYDPKTGRFTPTGSMASRRWSGSAATLLEDGRVLVEGGDASNVQEMPLATAELYNPATGSFTRTGSLAVARDTQSAVLISGGLVLVVGGDGHTAELYDPKTGAFSETGPAIVALGGGQTATALNHGRVLVVGGWDGVSLQPASSDAELYQP